MSLEQQRAQPVLTVRNVHRCARCDGDHENVSAYRLTRPMRNAFDRAPVYTHWFMCPRLDEPVMIAIVADTPVPQVTP